MPSPFLRTILIATIAFLTLVDLFAMQAVLPSLIERFQVDASAMGVAVNASTIGMAIASLAVSIVGEKIDRRRGIALSLLLLSLPTFLLAGTHELPLFAGLRITQGLFMASAFTLMLAHLGEHFASMDRASVFAAYIAGNVASNFIGRLLSATLVDQFGLTTTFFVFAGLNLAGAVLVFLTVPRGRGDAQTTGHDRHMLLADHLGNRRLCACFAIGFLILFAFIGTFTYVNLVLILPPLGLGMMQLGFAYFVFLPSIITTLAAGGLASRYGTGLGLLVAFGLALAGLPMLLSGSLTLVLFGLVIFAIGTFAAQAIVTGHVSRLATHGASTASGLYLASYFSGGLAGSFILGKIFIHAGWMWTVAAVGLALAIATFLVNFVLAPTGEATQAQD